MPEFQTGHEHSCSYESRYCQARMQEIDELLVTLKQRPNRQPRSVFSWIGGGIADLFGLAKFKDIQNVRGLLQDEGCRDVEG